jgi:carboxypeptidase C (cathepsin A)
MIRSNHPTCLIVLIALAACTTVAAAPDAAKAPDHKSEAFKASVQLYRTWNFSHQEPGQTQAFSARQGTNVMPDLANAMKLNPNLKVQLHAGYFDLATPFYQGIYEMHHLPIPPSLQANIEYRFYESGHMVYAKDASLQQLHDNVADFIRRTARSAQ